MNTFLIDTHSTYPEKDTHFSTHLQAAMTFLNTAVLCSYETNEFTFFFVICQMVKISIQHGLCSISAVAFSLYGALVRFDQ